MMDLCVEKGHIFRAAASPGPGAGGGGGGGGGGAAPPPLASPSSSTYAAMNRVQPVVVGVSSYVHIDGNGKRHPFTKEVSFYTHFVLFLFSFYTHFMLIVYSFTLILYSFCTLLQQVNALIAAAQADLLGFHAAASGDILHER